MCKSGLYVSGHEERAGMTETKRIITHSKVGEIIEHSEEERDLTLREFVKK